MALESATHITDLVTTNPVDTTDTVATLGDHVRLIKTVLKTDFATISGALTPTLAHLNKVGTTQAQSVNDASVASTAYVNTAILNASLTAELPAQTGNSGKFLGTNGSAASWELAIPDQAGNSGKFLTSNGSTASWAIADAIPRSARTSNTVLAEADKGTLIDITSGTFSQTLTALASLSASWGCFIRNSGAGNITLEPDGAEQIDGLTNFVMYPGETRMITRSNTAFFSVVLHPFTLTPAATLTFVEPPGYRAYEVFLDAPGGGGGSGRRGAAGSTRFGGGAGGAGGTNWAIVKAGTPGASITLTVGADGAGGAAVTADDTDGNNGTAGGDHSFGGILLAVGGAAGNGGSASAAAAGGAGTAPIGMVTATGTAGGAGSDAVSAAGTAATTWAPTGGGGGGGLDVGNTAHDGKAGGISGTGNSTTQLAGGIAGSASGTRPGGNGNSSVAQRGGTGGGGGASHASAAGAAGGNGVRGGGGGGGSASANGAASGAGGNGLGYYYVGGLL